MKLTIFSRLMISYVALFILVMAIGIYSIIHINRSNKITHSVMVTNNQITISTEKLADLLLSQIRFERKFIITRDRMLFEQFLKFKKDFDEHLNEILMIVKNLPMETLLKNAHQYYNQYHKIFEEEVNFLSSGQRYPQFQYKLEKETATNRFLGELEKLNSYNQQNAYEKIKSLHDSGATAKRVILLMAIGLLGLGILTSIFINRSITRPISIIKKKTREIARGNFKPDLKLSSPPEIEELAGALNFMCNKLNDLDRIKSDFFASISHELRTPLTSIHLGATLLLEEKGGVLTDKQKKLLTIVCEESHRLIDLVNSLLDLSRMEAGMMAYSYKKLSLTSLIQKVVREFGLLAEAKNINLVTTIEDLLEIRGDEERILQVLRNLIGNAVKFTPEGGGVRISARRIGQEVEVSITDTGPGVSKENLPHLFEKFYQLPHPELKQFKGTGLGLALVKQILNDHGGRIWVESELGKGSSFIFVLPIFSFSSHRVVTS